jgi:hypothetical protein
MVNTWMYGPIPLLVMWPATWAASAAHALLVAGALNIFVSLAAISAVCLWWPSPACRDLSRTDRLLAIALVAALWPELSWQWIQADNVAVALGLIGNLLLVKATGPRARWGAAFCAMAAVACKQTALGVAAAQIAWLVITARPRDALQHVGRYVVCGGAFTALFLPIFGWKEIYFSLVVLTSKLPWVPDPAQRILDYGPALFLQLIVPAVLLLVFRRQILRRDSGLLLPTLAWAFAIPPGLAGLLKIGGAMNSLESFPLWLPPAVVVGVAAIKSHRTGTRILAGCAGLVILGLGLRLEIGRALPWRPALRSYREAEYLAQNFPGQLWFPWNPLVTLYSENHYYSDEDGFFIRLVGGQPVPLDQARAGLPPRLSVIAIRRGDISWGIATHLAPPGAHRDDFGGWTLISWGSPP